MPSSTDTNKRLKKGILWSKEEDEILKAYVEKHGTRNWKEVSKNTGLAHCGNSCRFRWCNTLRPDVKKGPFSKEEEEKFFELYSKFGEFRWSMMALEMPGRTDNDIKNFWNGRKRKHERHGLSPFPDNMELVDGLKSSYGKRIRMNSQENKFKIPEVKFGNQILHTNLFDLPNKQFSKLIDDSNMFFNNVGSTSTLIDRDGVETSTISIPDMGYPQNQPPMETQYQMSESISPYKSGSLESMSYTQENWEGLDASCMHSQINLVDEKGKKPPISSENDVDEANHDDMMNPEFWNDTIITLFNEVYSNLHDKLPCDVNDALGSCMTMQSDLPPLPPPMETQYQMSEINSEEANLVDEKGKKLISSENDVEAYHDDIMNPKLRIDMISTLVDEVDNNLHDKLPYDVSDALDTCMTTMQSDLPPLPSSVETRYQMSEINNWKKAMALEEGVDENQIIWFEDYLYDYLV